MTSIYELLEAKAKQIEHRSLLATESDQPEEVQTV